MANAAHVVPERYEKVVRQTDLEWRRLTVPATVRDQAWGPNDPHGTVRVIRVCDGHGNLWDWRGRLRVDGQGNRKAEASGEEWRRFVRDKGIHLHDKLVFYQNPEHGGDPLFRVTVSRAMSTRLFGVDILVHGMEE